MDSDDVLHCNHNKLCTSVTTAYCFMFPPIDTSQPPSLYKFLSKCGGLFVFLHTSDQRVRCLTQINITSSASPNINFTSAANLEISVLRVFSTNMHVSCQDVVVCCQALLPRFRWQPLLRDSHYTSFNNKSFGRIT